MKKATVQVFKLDGFIRAIGARHGQAQWRQVFRVTKQEANLLTHKGYAVWRSKSKQAVTLLIPVRSLLLFVGQMRYKPLPEARGLDSKTTVQLPGIRGHRHERNEAYGRAGQILTGFPKLLKADGPYCDLAEHTYQRDAAA
jgi:hypothetical protein